MRINNIDYLINTFQCYLIFIGAVLLFSFVLDYVEPRYFSLLDGYLFVSFLAIVFLIHKEAREHSREYSREEKEKLKELMGLDR